MQVFNFAMMLALSFFALTTLLGLCRWERLGPADFAAGQEHRA